MKTLSLQTSLFILLGAAILFIPFLGAVHLFDWDEINFAESAREMIATHNYSTPQIDFVPFWEKPPVFIWMQAFSMNIFGVNEFAARLPNAICGIITLLLVFRIGSKIYDSRFGMLWVLAYAGSLLPHFYFKSGIIDPWFNLFIFLGIYNFILYTNDNQSTKGLVDRNILLSALFMALAVMTKGPVAALVFGLCFAVSRVWNRKRLMSWKHFFLYAVTLTGLGCTWFLILAIQGRSDIISDFITYQIRLFSTEDADHGGPFFYHWVVLLIGCFPASVFAIRGFFRSQGDTPFQRHFKRWMLVLFWVVLILFSIVKTKIVHYSSLCYFPLTFLAAYTAFKLINRELEWKKWMSALMITIGTILGLALASIQFINAYKNQIIESKLIKDPFAESCLQADVHWYGWEFLIGILLVVGVILCVIRLSKGSLQKPIWALFLITLVVTNLSALVFANRVEGYSQREAIRFYESLQNKDCYVGVAGFKSYAHLFYSRKKPEMNQSPLFLAYAKEHLKNGLPPKQSRDEFMTHLFYQWLQESPEMDKPVYIVCKITDTENFSREHKQFHLLYAKNGFAFFFREKAAF